MTGYSTMPESFGEIAGIAAGAGPYMGGAILLAFVLVVVLITLGKQRRIRIWATHTLIIAIVVCLGAGLAVALKNDLFPEPRANVVSPPPKPLPAPYDEPAEDGSWNP